LCLLCFLNFPIKLKIAPQNDCRAMSKIRSPLSAHRRLIAGQQLRILDRAVVMNLSPPSAA
jgi:hypothetical protein